MRHARNKTLLPNLTQLTLETASAMSNQLMWIRTFLSPTLVEISVVPFSTFTPLISYLEASTLLRHITATCPSLQFLSLFPAPEDPVAYHQGLRDSRMMISFWDSSLPQYLAQMSSLRKLTTTTEVFMPETLVSLARLPHLHSLNIYPTDRPFKIKTLAPQNSFDALRNFSLYSAPHSLFAEVWGLQCFKHITSLNLVFISCPESKEDEESWVSALLSLISNNSPDLARLSIDFDPHYANEYLITLCHNADLQFTEKLPLKYLELRSACLGADNNQCDDSIYSMLPTVWSQLTVLKLPDEEGIPSKLYWFSKILHLEHLTLRLSLTTPLPDLMTISGPKNMCIGTLESSGTVDVTGDTRQIARYVSIFYCLPLTLMYSFQFISWLVSLWPTLKKVDWFSKTDEDEDEDEDEGSRSTSEAIASGLNGMIMLLRELNETKSRLARETYGSQAMELFPKDL
jgi:hypothetical protein